MHTRLLLWITILAGLCSLVVTGFQKQDAGTSTTTTTTSRLTSSNNSSKLLIASNITFPYTVTDNEVSTLYFNYSFFQAFNEIYSRGPWVITAFLDNEKLASIVNKKEFHIAAESPSGVLSVFIMGHLPGRTTLYFRGKAVVNKSNFSDTGDGAFMSDIEEYGQTSWQILIERKYNPADTAFTVIVILLVVLLNIGIGAKVDLAVVKAQLKRPYAPIIGLCSQFIFMPLVAFAVVSTIEMDPGIALGLFALGCAPGGSASNSYTYLLDGNVSLSVTMTLISTLASLGFFPLWLFTLGRIIYSEGNVKIPFQNIFLSLLGIIAPVLVGLFLQRKLPKVAKCFINAIIYIMILFILFVMTVGVYINLFIFSLMSAKVLLASALLPYLGFILGGFFAFILRQDITNIITIAVETGIQNTGIPIVLLRISLQGPDKDTSIVAPVSSAILTPIPLIFGILFVQIRKRIKAQGVVKDNSVLEFVHSDKEQKKSTNLSENVVLVTEEDQTK